MKPDAALSLLRAAVTETAYATVGLTAYALDAVRRPPSIDDVKERASDAVGDPLGTLVATTTALSGKGRRTLGKAGSPERSAPAAGAREAMEREETATPARSEAPTVTDPVAPPAAGPVPERPAAEPAPAPTKVEPTPAQAEEQTSASAEPETTPATAPQETPGGADIPHPTAESQAERREAAEAQAEPTEPAADVPLQHDLSELTVAELRQLASDADIEGRSSMKKKHLIEALEEYRSRT